jgi:hypothetical protein
MSRPSTAHAGYKLSQLGAEGRAPPNFGSDSQTIGGRRQVCEGVIVLTIHDVTKAVLSASDFVLA